MAFFLCCVKGNSMRGCSQIICALVGFSASAVLYLPNLKKRKRRQTMKEKLRLVDEALEHAEERVVKFQERHDRLLDQVCLYYLCNQRLDEALVGAQAAMNEALEFAVTLRKMQMKIISSYPDEAETETH